MVVTAYFALQGAQLNANPGLVFLACLLIAVGIVGLCLPWEDGNDDDDDDDFDLPDSGFPA